MTISRLPRQLQDVFKTFSQKASSRRLGNKKMFARIKVKTLKTTKQPSLF